MLEPRIEFKINLTTICLCILGFLTIIIWTYSNITAQESSGSWSDTFSDESKMESYENIWIDGNAILDLSNTIIQDRFDDNDIDKNLWNITLTENGSIEEKNGEIILSANSTDSESNAKIKSFKMFDMTNNILEFKLKADKNKDQQQIGIKGPNGSYLVLGLEYNGNLVRMKMSNGNVSSKAFGSFYITNWHTWKFLWENEQLNLYRDNKKFCNIKPLADDLKESIFYGYAKKNNNNLHFDFIRVFSKDSTYYTSGTLTSIPIVCDPYHSYWYNINIDKAEFGEDCKIKMSIIDNKTNKPIEGFENLTESKIDISTIDPFEYPVIILKSDFFGNGTTTPILNKYEVKWISNEDWNDTFKGASKCEYYNNLTIKDGNVSLSLVNPGFEDEFDDGVIDENLWSLWGDVYETTTGRLILTIWGGTVQSKKYINMTSYDLEFNIDFQSSPGPPYPLIGIKMPDDNEILFDGYWGKLRVKIDGKEKKYNLNLDIYNWHRWKFIKENKNFNIYRDDELKLSLEEGNYSSDENLEKSKLYNNNGGCHQRIDYVKTIPKNPIYFKSKTLISKNITIPPHSWWDKVQINKTEFPSNTIKISVLNATNNKLISNFEDISLSEIDISEIDPEIYRKIKLQANFQSNESATPTLHDWKVSWKFLPIAKLLIENNTVYTNEEILFDATESFDRNNDEIKYFKYNFGDGNETDWIESKTIKHKYTNCGIYSARLKVKTKNGVESFWSKELNITIKNLNPQALSLNFSKFYVLKTSSISIFANGSDAEESESKLSCHIQYRSSTSNWIDLDNEIFQKDYWKAIFSPSNEMEIGLYDFRVNFTDSNGGYSGWLEKLDVVEVKNKPVVKFISLSDGAKIDKTKKSIIIKGTAFVENGKIIKVQIKIDDGEWQDVEGTNNWTYEWDLTNVKVGKHTISVRAFDGTFYSEIEKITVNVVEDEGLNIIYIVPIIGIIAFIGIIGFLYYRKSSSMHKAPTTIQQSQIQQQPHQLAQPTDQLQSPTRKCPYCNTQVPSEFTFCIMCGKMINQSQSQ